MTVPPQDAHSELIDSSEHGTMKINKNGELVVSAGLLKTLGLKSGDEVEIEMSRHGILIKPEKESAEKVMKWLRDEHGDEMATLTNDQIFHLLK